MEPQQSTVPGTRPSAGGPSNASKVETSKEASRPSPSHAVSPPPAPTPVKVGSATVIGMSPSPTPNTTTSSHNRPTVSSSDGRSHSHSAPLHQTKQSGLKSSAQQLTSNQTPTTASSVTNKSMTPSVSNIPQKQQEQLKQQQKLHYQHQLQLQQQQQLRMQYQRQQTQILTPFNAINNPEISSYVTTILTLLQRYGPLTYDQLRSNLPPLNLSTSMSFYDTSPSSDARNIPNGKEKKVELHDILEILVVVNVIHKGKLKRKTDADMTTVKSDDLDRYYFGNGMPRAETDVILPHEILDLIQDANSEITRSKQRIEMLKKELGSVKSEWTDDWDSDGKTSELNGIEFASSGTGYGKRWYFDSEEEDMNESNLDNTKDMKSNQGRRRVRKNLPPLPPTSAQQIRTTREFLKSLLYKYPEIVYDPVYAACLRNFNVDMSATLASLNPGDFGMLGKSKRTSAGNPGVAKKRNSTGSQGIGPKRKRTPKPKVQPQKEKAVPTGQVPINQLVQAKTDKAMTVQVPVLSVKPTPNPILKTDSTDAKT